MHISRTTIHLPVALLIFALVGALGYQTARLHSESQLRETMQMTLQAASSSSNASRAPSVASVDLRRLLELLEQRADAKKEIDATEADFRTNLEARSVTLKALETELNEFRTKEEAGTALTPAEEARVEEVRKELTKGLLSAQAYRQFIERRLDVDVSILLRELFDAASSAVESMAMSEGYDIVIVNDGGGEIVVNPNAQVSAETQVVQQMTARRVLFVSEAADITEALAVRMNNAWKNG